MANLNKKSDVYWLRLMNYGKKLGCHQLEERSFYLFGYQFFVCARCTGVIIGEILSVLLLIMGVKISIYYSILFQIVMGIDWFIQYLNILQSTNIRRLVTGFFAGVGLTYIYFYILVFFFQSCRNIFLLF